MLCAIHQPNFFPWLGYFDKIKRADIFVFLDDVQYPRSGSGAWPNRVKIAIQGEPQWFSCPLNKKTIRGAIKDVKISADPKWRRKAVKTLEVNYKKAAYYEKASAILEPLILNPTDCLANFNMKSIKTIASAMAIDAQYICQSQLETKKASTDLLIEICKKVGADAYLAGGGASGYQEDEKFADAGVELVYQNFEAEAYGPSEKFLSGLSVIDYIMHEGLRHCD